MKKEKCNAFKLQKITAKYLAPFINKYTLGPWRDVSALNLTLSLLKIEGDFYSVADFEVFLRNTFYPNGDLK